MKLKRLPIVLLALCGALVWGVSAALAAPAAQIEAGQEYTVQPGDCLATIAARFLGGQRYWQAIWQANNMRAMADPRFAPIRDPNLIYSGQLLYLPGAAEAETLLPPADPEPARISSDSPNGLLAVDIAYLGQWYRDTFDYRKDAPNIRHFALVVPEAQYLARPFSPGELCSSLNFPAENAPPEIGEGAAVADWDLSVLHPVPYEVELEPGRYYVGGCFIAAALSREEAGVGEEAVLYAGITGGGASSEFEPVDVAAGVVKPVTITLTDADGWACPWVYVFDGSGFERRTEILRNLKTSGRQATQRSPLGLVAVRDGVIRLQIREEKAETTYLDALYVQVGGVAVWPAGGSPQVERLRAADGQVLVLEQGDVLELSFNVAAVAGDSAWVEAVLVAAGYYD